MFCVLISYNVMGINNFMIARISEQKEQKYSIHDLISAAHKLGNL